MNDLWPKPAFALFWNSWWLSFHCLHTTPGLSPWFTITQGRFCYWKGFDSRLGERNYNAMKWPKGDSEICQLKSKSSVPLAFCFARKWSFNGRKTVPECLRKKMTGNWRCKERWKKRSMFSGSHRLKCYSTAVREYDSTVTYHVVSADMTRAIISESISPG